MIRLFYALSTHFRCKIRYSVFHSSGKQLSSLRLGLTCLGLWLLPTVTMTSSGLAAEKIYGSYGALERSISVEALETYAQEGKLDEDLAVYVRYFNSQQLAQLRRVLLGRIDLNSVAVSQFLYTPIGETLLERLGQLIQTESRQPGFYALRAALILAAADEPKGLTLLNVLRKFPTRSIRIDLGRSLQLAEQLEQLINQTKETIALIKQQGTTATTKLAIDFQLPDLRQSGKFTWNKQILTLYDRKRDRKFFADIYLPQPQTVAIGEQRESNELQITKPFPVIVISHGLGSDRSSFEYLAMQLASYGFAVAVPEHPGSNAEQLRSLLAGQSNTVAEPNEFISRPLDVKYLLDELQRIDQVDATFELNLQQVGIIGQSFGGYTALALAGARLNFDQLKQDCDTASDSWNVSLLLQCRVLELPNINYNLHDQRVKAAIAINPITSSVFGDNLSQIQIPVTIVSSSADTAAPALSEQILPFTWLTTSEKYLVLLEGGTHFSTIGESNPQTDPIAVPAEVIGPNPAIARRYMKALSVAFFQTYLYGASQYRPYLSSAYAQVISQAELPLSIVESLPPNQLFQDRKQN